MNDTTPQLNPILMILVAAIVVFTVGLLLMTVTMRTLSNPASAPTATVDVSQIPLTPLPATPSRATNTPSPTPTANPVATATPSPTATIIPPTNTPEWTATPTMTATFTPVPVPTVYGGPFRRNGADYVSARREGIVLDGILSDWAGVPAMPLTFVQQGAANWEGSSDLSVTMFLTWDAQNLYVAAQIIDDLHSQTLSGYDIYNGDSVELWLDIDLAGDFPAEDKSADDFQFGLSPGDFSTLRPEGVIWFASSNSQSDQQMRVTATPQENGYTLEAAIPWSLLGVSPHSGMVFGYGLAANDNDTPGAAAQETILTHSAQMVWGRPTTFSNLSLQ